MRAYGDHFIIWKKSSNLYFGKHTKNQINCQQVKNANCEPDLIETKQMQKWANDEMVYF